MRKLAFLGILIFSMNFLLACDSDLSEVFLENKFFALDGEKNLYLKKEKKQEELLASQVEKNSLTFNQEKKRLYFLRNNGLFYDLYSLDLEGDSGEMLLTRNVKEYSLLSGNLFYINMYDNLFVKEVGKDSQKIAEDVLQLHFFSSPIYLGFKKKSDEGLWVYGLRDEKLHKLDKNGEILDIVDGYLYLVENRKEGTSDLYRMNEKKKEMILERSKNFLLLAEARKVFYQDSSDDLYVYHLETKKQEKLAENIYDFLLDSEGKNLLYKNKLQNVYYKPLTGNSKKIDKNLVAWQSLGDKFFYLNAKNILYLVDKGKKEKLAESVENFSLSPDGQTLAYFDLEGRLYVDNFKKGKALLLEDISLLESLYFNQELLYGEFLDYESFLGKYSLVNNPYKDYAEAVVEVLADGQIVLYTQMLDRLDEKAFKDIYQLEKIVPKSRISSDLIFPDGEVFRVRVVDKNLLILEADLKVMLEKNFVLRRLD